MNLLVIDEEDLEFIWGKMRDLQLIFHPKYFYDGIISYEKIEELKSRKKVIIILDRNLLSSLINLSRSGRLSDEYEMRIIALLMTWTIMNDFHVSPGLALKEYATKINDKIEPKRELCEFNNIFDYYPSMTWLHLAEGVIDRIPVCPLAIQPANTDIEYNKKGDHLLMHIATMIRVVNLFRSNLTPCEKMVSFLKWYYKYLLVCETTIVYVAMLFTNQEGIKAPKNACSNNVDRILKGCINQAWDINYLSNWSCYHYYENTMNEIFLFATNDIQLKKYLLILMQKGVQQH